MDLFKKYLLTTVARFAPPDPPAGDSPDGDERIEVDLDDDVEDTHDPEGEPYEDAEDDEQDDDAATAGAGGEEPPARETRGNRQFGELRKQARERAEENARLTRELAEMRGQITALRQPVQHVESAQQRADRLALLSPDERADAIISERLAVHDRNQQQLANQLLDQSDRSSFEAQAATNPLFKKLQPEVERRRQMFVQAGQGVPPRATIATYLIGERVLEQRGKGEPAARQRRRQQQARPTNSRGDVASPRRERRSADPVSDFEGKYGDVPI
jgi:hypothetical protein